MRSNTLITFHLVLTIFHRVLLATIRDFGLYPCPRCYTPQSKLDLFGTVEGALERLKVRLNTSVWRRTVATAHHRIYKQGYTVNSVAVDGILKERSWVPVVVSKAKFISSCLDQGIQNAFHEALGDNFHVSRMLVPDIMHEGDAGNWKNVFTHLLRLIGSVDSVLVVELDRRCVPVPENPKAC